MPSIPRVFLFDIDKTLLIGKMTGTSPFYTVLAARFGREIRPPAERLDGRTDGEIIAATLRENGIIEELQGEELSRILREFALAYEENFHRYSAEALPGAHELLSELQLCGALLGLITGNCEKVGRRKLAHVGLESYFSFGGFAEDGLTRVQVLKSALLRTRAQAPAITLDEVIVFGDTPRDVEAATECGVSCVGVSTGAYGAEDLLKAGARFVLGSLAEREQLWGHFAQG